VADDDGQEKKHEPGERGWQQAADRGEMPRSADVGAAASVLAAASMLWLSSDVITAALSDVMVVSLVAHPRLFDLNSAVSLLHSALEATTRSIAPALLAAAGAGLLAGLAQTRGQIATEAFDIKWDRLDPIGGLTNLLGGWTPWVELGKNLGRFAVVGVAAGVALSSRLSSMPSSAAMPPDALPGILLDLGVEIVLAAAPAMLLVATVDYAWSWWKMREKLMRTDQQLKDERKEQEGDPHIKAKRRQMARQLAVAGGLAAVRTADVVITNPTHFAVALRYERGRDAAPIVVAKGVDAAALRIRAEARRTRVDQIERRSLARALHAKVRVGDPIPEALYIPVARVLAVVWRRRGTHA